MKKVKNETDATFLHVYDVFASKFRHFLKIKTYFKVINLFKAKKEAFRERNSQKVKNDPILLHLTLRFLDRDENGFLASARPNLVPNQCFLVHSVEAEICKLNKIFNFSILVKNLMEFQ